MKYSKSSPKRGIHGLTGLPQKQKQENVKKAF